ncbi:MAG TPA: chitobiase/beta-hexosaminidase C-terminal domain-containing protein, partial [Lacipirellulaceae bacterium]
SKSNPQWMFQRLTTNPEFRLRVADRIHKHFFNDGVLTVAKARELFDQRTAEIFQAVVAESARWGDAKRSTPLTRADWQTEVNRVRNNYIPGRTNTVFNQLLQDNLYPTLGAPLFSRFGGLIEPGVQLTLSKPVGSPGAATIYYTLDGSDPRSMGGGLSASAVSYTGPITLNASIQVKARIRNGSDWSALVEADFIVPPAMIPGDYDGNGLVDDGDYNFWRSSFSLTVAPSSGADGSGNGVVDAADYVIWRRHAGNGSLAVATGAAVRLDETASERGSPLSTPEPAAGSVTLSAALAETFYSPLGNERAYSPPRLRSAWRPFGDGSSENLLELLASHRVRDAADAAGNSRLLARDELAIDQPSDRLHSSFDDALADWPVEASEQFSIWRSKWLR